MPEIGQGMPFCGKKAWRAESVRRGRTTCPQKFDAESGKTLRRRLEVVCAAVYVFYCEPSVDFLSQRFGGHGDGLYQKSFHRVAGIFLLEGVSVRHGA